MIKSFKGEWLDLISVFIQDNKIRTLLNAVWLSEDAMLDFFIFFLIILRTFLFLLNNVMTIKKMFYVGVWINRIIKAFICSFPFYWWVLKLRVIKILTFGGQKLFTGNGYNLPFLLKKKQTKTWNQLKIKFLKLK